MLSNLTVEKRPKVTVLITYHNDGWLLDRAIESVLSQTYDNYEVLVVTDTMDRGFPAFARVIEVPECQAYTKWNIGAKNAAGEYVALLPADDQWMPQKLEKQLAAIESYGMCVHQTKHVNEQNEPYQNFRTRSIEQVKNQSKSDWDKRFHRGNLIFACTVLYRKSLHAEIGYFDDALINMGDLEFFIRANRHSGIKVVEEVLSLDRVLDGKRDFLIRTAKEDLAEIRKRHY